jgi:hypothetical protein
MFVDDPSSKALGYAQQGDGFQGAFAQHVPAAILFCESL